MQSQDRELQGSSLGFVSGNGIMFAGGWDVRANLSHDLLELSNVLIQRILLGGREGGQSRNESCCGEAHGDDVCAVVEKILTPADWTLYTNAKVPKKMR